MKIGLTYTARIYEAHVNDSGAPDVAMNGAVYERSNGFPDDTQEEFDSPETVEAIAAALTSLDHDVELLGDGQPLIRRLVAGDLPQMVFNIAEGRGISRSREAWTPALLEMFGIPYTGSDPLTLAATLDKHCAKRLVREVGVAVPASVVVNGSSYEFATGLAALPLPVIVKPAFEGSSKGISAKSVVDNYAEVHGVVASCQEVYRQPVLVEQFIDGDEITVGILGNQPTEVIGILRVIPLQNCSRFVYGLEVKRDWRRRVRYEVPAQLSPADEAAIRRSALTAYRALGCRDVARLDFRLCDGVPYFLEANPLPGLAPGASDLVLLAEGMGIGYRELIGRILDAAVLRHRMAGAFCGDINSKSSPIAGDVFIGG